MGLIERLLFGSAAKKAKDAEERLAAAGREKAEVQRDGDVLRAELLARVEEVCLQAKRSASEPPPRIELRTSILDQEELDYGTG